MFQNLFLVSNVLLADFYLLQPPISAIRFFQNYYLVIYFKFKYKLLNIFVTFRIYNRGWRQHVLSQPSSAGVVVDTFTQLCSCITYELKSTYISIFLRVIFKFFSFHYLRFLSYLLISEHRNSEILIHRHKFLKLSKHLS